MTKQELNSKLREINEKKIANGNGFIMQGTNKVGKDLLPLLQNGEEIVDFCDARISSLFKFFKGTRYARCYLVITTNRFIYIERGNVIMGLNPLAKKTVLIERNSMSGDVVANSGMEKAFYPYLLRISSNSGQYQISVKDDVSPYLQVGSIVNPMEETKVERKVSQEFAEGIKEPSHRFCRYCGKEVEDTWVKCPYCGNILQENRKQGNVEQEKYVNAQTGINGNYVPNNTMLNNQPPKKKKKLPFIIGGVVAAVVLLLVLLFGGSDNPAPQEVVELSSYENGFAGWEASGFEGSVKTDITIPYPLTDTGRNNYAVYIGVGKTNVGIIMQEDESAISEWDWLMNAQPDMETQAYYFNCTLTYANQTAGENNTPVFVIENVQEANDIENVQEANDIENQQVMAGLDVSMYVGGDVDNLLQADNHLSTDDGEFYVDETENVTVSVIDGNIDMFMINGETDYPINFAGVSVGDSAYNMSDDELVNAGYTYYMEDASGIVYLYSDNMAGVVFRVDASECIDAICWTNNCAEMLDASMTTDNEMGVSNVDYGLIYGGILDGIIGDLNSGMSDDELYYAFYDIDKDGYLEFFIENGYLEYEVWTTTGEGCSCLGTISDARNIGLYECVDGNGVYTDFCHMGYEVITLVESKDGMLTETSIFEGENLEEYGYHLDGTPFEELAYPIPIHMLQEGLVW